jgi:putative hydrolase of the HAD superfamily
MHHPAYRFPKIDQNNAFVGAMQRFGYDGIKPNDIDKTGKTIREEMAQTDPEAAAILTHTEIRMLAIRRQMESICLLRSLDDVAKDWATTVSDLTPIIVENCKTFAKKEVSDSVVQAVYNAWEMERHHAAERHLYPEVVDALKQIKEEHPGVVIGAVTDGKANPMLMTFTLAPYFDFCMSWEDDQGGRSKFFKELSSTGSDAELQWIYEAALDKYKELAKTRGTLKKDKEAGGSPDDKVWIHVGDDLAYDVGGSHSVGARTILFELADKYGQTARHRFDNMNKLPSWSVTTTSELEKRKIMNVAAERQVDVKLSFISRLPEAINDILDDADAE